MRKAAFRLGERVFNNVTWTFREDEQWVVHGTNGSGKSLFADAVRGRLPLVHGTLEYHFDVPSEVQGAEAAIAYVSVRERHALAAHSILQSRWNSFEEPGQMAVRDFLSYEAALEINPFVVRTERSGGRAAFNRRLRRVLALLNLDRFLDCTLLSLSNGEMQKVCLARALARPLCLLILDEPFEGLDSLSRNEFGRILTRLMQRGLHLLLLTERTDGWPGGMNREMLVQNCEVAYAGELRRRRSKSSGDAFRVRSLQSRSAQRVAPQESSGAMPMLARMNKVSVRYGNQYLLKEVSWTIREGESWALLGPNGAGKTTLLNLLCGDHPQAYRNDIEIFGRKRGLGESIWDIKHQIGFVSPELHLHFPDDLTCLEVVASGFFDTVGLWEPVKRTQRVQTLHLLKRFGLERVAQQPLCALSTGRQRMALLARALVKRPRLLILDEPCQGLDQGNRRLFLRTLDKLLRRQATTVIYVTHRNEEIPRTIKRVLQLKAGQVVEA